MSENNCCYISIAFDAGARQCYSVFNVRWRVISKSQIYNLRLLTIPMTSRNTRKDRCNYIAILLAKIAGDNWMEKIIGISLDGTVFIVGHVSGAVTTREQMIMSVIF